MEQAGERSRSYLFTVRVWEEEVATDASEWRGKVQLLPVGEVRYFRSWETLVPVLRAMLAALEGASESQQS
jgi:hypothetical protein